VLALAASGLTIAEIIKRLFALRRYLACGF